MNTLLESPHNEYLLLSSVTDLYNESGTWLSELEFSQTELIFFSILFDHYFRPQSDQPETTELVATELRIKLFVNKQLKNLQQDVLNHIKRLGNLSEDLPYQDEQAIRDEHHRCELKMKDMLRELKKIKKEVFAWTEKQLKLEKISK